MEINCYRVKNLSYIVVDDFFTAVELENVLQEVRDLKRFLLPADKTASAANPNGDVKKTGTGVFLDGLYKDNRDASAILQANRKLFSPEITERAEQLDVVFNFISSSTEDHTLLNYYTANQEYKAHKDDFRISAVTFLNFGHFTGGDFIFPEQNECVEAKHNRAVIFPSCTTHQAGVVKGEGARVSIAQFIDQQVKPNA